MSRYGISVSGLILEDIADRDGISRKVGSLIHELHETLDFLYGAHNRAMYEGLWLSTRECYRARAKLIQGASEEAYKFLDNTIMGICRNSFRAYMINRGNLPNKTRTQLLSKHKQYYQRFCEAREKRVRDEQRG